MTTEINRRAALRRAAAMLGGTLSAPTVLAAVLAACDRPASERAVRSDSGSAAKPYALRTLDARQNAMVVTISEAIIPETDTPGARAARVNEFVDAMVTDYFPAKERERFLAGLARVDAGAQRVHGKAFLELSSEEQVAVLEEFDRAAYGDQSGAAKKTEAQQGGTQTRTPAIAAEKNPVTQKTEGEVSTGRGGTGGMMASGAVSVDGKVDPEDVGGRSFFRTIKELTLVGYYTSELGSTQELHPVPMGPFKGDIPLSQVGRAWA